MLKKNFHNTEAKQGKATIIGMLITERKKIIWAYYVGIIIN